MIHHKRTREDRHKNTPNALAIYVRVRVLPTGDPGKQQLVRSACPCAGPPGVPLCWTQNTCSRYRFIPICCDVPVLWTKNCGTGTWWFVLFCSDLAVWYVLIRVLSVRLAIASVCFWRFSVLGRDTTQWAVRRHLSAGAWKTKTQKLRHLSCARALGVFPSAKRASILTATLHCHLPFNGFTFNSRNFVRTFFYPWRLSFLEEED